MALVGGFVGRKTGSPTNLADFPPPEPEGERPRPSLYERKKQLQKPDSEDPAFAYLGGVESFPEQPTSSA